MDILSSIERNFPGASPLLLLTALAFCSCSNQPTAADIKSKLDEARGQVLILISKEASEALTPSELRQREELLAIIKECESQMQAIGEEEQQ